MALLNYKEAQTNFKQILRKVPGEKATQENLKQCVNYLKKKEAFERAIAGNEKSLVIFYVIYDGMLNVEVMGRARVGNQLARERNGRGLGSDYRLGPRLPPVHDQALQVRWETPEKSTFSRPWSRGQSHNTSGYGGMTMTYSART
ncbi:hypothetical protein OXX80_005575 [Metschnikowia pulcherrima]